MKEYEVKSKDLQKSRLLIMSKKSENLFKKKKKKFAYEYWIRRNTSTVIGNSKRVK